MNTEKKGELAELKASLRQLAGSRAPGSTEAKRELFKKVISYMTIGIDVSGLFTEMIMGSGATSDLVLKKMCYLYICSYAQSNSELALLTINFLQKDCQDDDPMIRGLALRSLCSLRVKNLVEYLVGPLKTAIRDSNPYVRTMAAMGILKLFYLAPAACKDAELVPALKRLLMNDPDPQVVANAVCALQEIFSDETGSDSGSNASGRDWLLSKEVIYTLLNRIRDFSEWAQCIILSLAAEYVPEESEEIFDIMNLLEDRLQHANSAVVLATTKVFLHLTMSMADVHQQVYERIKAPLLTLISTGSSELAYAVLSHLHLLVTRAPMLFAADYKHFYCRFSDPSYVKKLKLEMLTAVANETNTYDIVAELSEYAANVDVVIARESVRAVGQIALQSYDVNGIVDRLLQFLDMDTDYITAETLVLVKDLLRKYPEWAESCVAVIGGVEHASVSEREAKAALVWMLGEYGQDVSDAPYVLESVVEGWAEEESEAVRLEILTAVAKLFFKRPPECHGLLGRALKLGTEDSNQDVHDRALLYYRLLQQGADVAERVINPPKRAVNEFAETQSSEAKDRIFDEFNTLSVVYRQPSFQFMAKEQPKAGASSEEEPTSPTGVLQTGADFADQELLSGAEKEDVAAPPPAAAIVSNGGETYSAPNVLDIMSGPVTNGNGASVSGDPFAASAQASLADLGPSSSIPGGSMQGGGLDDLLAGFGGPSTSQQQTPPPPVLQLNPRPTLDAGTFQRKWGQLPVAQSLQETLQPQANAKLSNPQALLRHMASNSIACMASGAAGGSLRFFFYAQNTDSGAGDGFFLVELMVSTSQGTASAKIKGEQAHLVESFAQLFRTAVLRF